MADERARPVVVVTGANAGVGFAICERLLVQLCQPIPPDALPQRSLERYLPSSLISNTPGSIPGSSPEPYIPNASTAKTIYPSENVDDLIASCKYDGLTLILACRDLSKAEVARAELFATLEREVARQKKERKDARTKVLQSRRMDGRASNSDVVRGNNDDDDGMCHAERFSINLTINIHHLDLASTASVFQFANTIREKYPYVSHLVCNAGVAAFCGYDWIMAAKQLLTAPIEGVTVPTYKLQRSGLLSKDNLGWIWQCNVFGHYVLYRQLEPLLQHYKTCSGGPSRVLWMGSVEGRRMYAPEDWQLIKCTHPYEGSKHQIDLLATYLEEQQRRHCAFGREPEEESVKLAQSLSSTPPSLLEHKSVPIQHILCHPGIVRTNIAVKSLNNVWLDYLMQLAFLLVHFLGSRNHVMTPYRSAISAVHLMLVSLPFVTAANNSTLTRAASIEKTERGNKMFDNYARTAGAEANLKLRRVVSSASTSSSSISSSSSSSSSAFTSSPSAATTTATLLTPIPASPSLSPSPRPVFTSPSPLPPSPLKFASQIDFWFNEYVDAEEIEEWEMGGRREAAELEGRCDVLYRAFLKGREKQRERDERMRGSVV